MKPIHMESLLESRRGTLAGVRRYFRELAEGFRILRSREFWRAFRAYWSADAVSKRLDEYAARLRGESHDGR